jgi:hypothetical protein
LILLVEVVEVVLVEATPVLATAMHQCRLGHETAFAARAEEGTAADVQSSPASWLTRIGVLSRTPADAPEAELLEAELPEAELLEAELPPLAEVPEGGGAPVSVGAPTRVHSVETHERPSGPAVSKDLGSGITVHVHQAVDAVVATDPMAACASVLAAAALPLCSATTATGVEGWS